jgi:hypothetical protein
MAIEHRWGIRQAAAFRVVIDDRRLGLIQGEMRDVSASGVFVRTSIKPGDNALVKLAIVLPDEDVTRVVQAWAVVVRSDPDGVGMMFDHFESEKLALLMAQLPVPAMLSAGGTGPALRRATTRPARPREQARRMS